MTSKAKHPLHKKLTQKYLFGLCCIVVLTISSYLILKSYIKQCNSDGYIINLSGQQRFLSQRIALHCLELTTYTNKDKDSLRSMLREEINKAYTIHNILEEADTIEILNTKKSPLRYRPKEILAIYYNSPFYFDLKLHQFLSNALKIADLADTSFALENKELQYILQQNATILQLSDRIVSVYQQKHDDRIKHLLYIEKSILLLSLIALILIGWILFRPMVNNITSQFEMLQLHKENLNELNNKLEHKVNERTNELLQKNKELEAFIYRSSHDMRGPLASILGLTNIMHNEITDKTTLKYTEMIQRSTTRLDNILLDLVNISRIKKGILVITEVNICSTIHAIIQQLKFTPAFDEKCISITTEKDCIINTDQNFLITILQNLIENAMKHNEHPDLKINITIKHKNGSVEIAVQDNGRGIEEEVKEKIFDMFFRGNAKSKGTGLGLYIVKESVEKIKGKIFVDSKVNKGSTFTVCLPDTNIN